MFEQLRKDLERIEEDERRENSARAAAVREEIIAHVTHAECAEVLRDTSTLMHYLFESSQVSLPGLQLKMLCLHYKRVRELLDKIPRERLLELAGTEPRDFQ